MTVYFVGAGPGAADLITIRGAEIISHCPVCLYAGSLVPPQIIAGAGKKYADKNINVGDVIVADSATMTLDDIIDFIKTHHHQGKDIARVHSGDPSVYGAISEQIQRLRYHDIPFEIIPGVSAYAAAAAALEQELTLPDISQTIIITRTATRSSAMPVGEDLSSLAAHQATLAIHLSITNLANVVKDLLPHYGKDCPVIVAYRVGWDDEMFIHGNLSNIRDKIKKEKITRTALILVGHVLGASDHRESKLYDPAHHHIFRKN